MEKYKKHSFLFPVVSLFIIIITLSILIYSKSSKITIIERKVKYRIDSVKYHPIGSDNTLQVTPYWKIYIKEIDLSVTQYKKFNPGDTIELIEKRILEME